MTSSAGGGSIMKALRLALFAAALAGGCATSSPPPATSGAADEARQATRLTRCSAADPDRSAWFCVVGQILYSTLSMFQQDISSRLP
jgi:hypothetical protein